MAIKTTKKQFEQFKKTFLYWQKKMSLMDWKVYFDLSNIGRNFAKLEMSYPAKVATATLTESVENKYVLEDFNPKLHAKHEALHLLVAPIHCIGLDRFTSESEVIAANESVVNCLMTLL